MYKIAKDHGTLNTPWGTWHAGEPFIPNPKIPQDKLMAWRQKGIIETDESGPDVEELIDTADVLTVLSRKELIQVIKDNGLNTRSDGTAIKVMVSWPDEAIRQAIRDTIPDLSTLTILGKKPEPASVL